MEVVGTEHTTAARAVLHTVAEEVVAAAAAAAADDDDDEGLVAVVVAPGAACCGVALAAAGPKCRRYGSSRSIQVPLPLLAHMRLSPPP